MPGLPRVSPGLAPKMEDTDEDSQAKGSIRLRGPRLGTPGTETPDSDLPKRPWWRPTSKVARIFLALGALVVLAGMGTSAYLLKQYLGQDPRFRIAGSGNIKATGLTEVSRAEVLPVFGEDIGRNIFFVPLSERRRQLEEIPWVERATVMRLLPDQIRVQVVERQPVAFARQGQQFGLVDANGVLLTMPAAMMAQHHYSFPTLTGIDAGDPLASRKARMQVYLRLLAELDANGQKISEQISEIDLTDPEDARVTMSDDTTLLHFGEDHFAQRYQHYKANIAGWRQQYPKLTAVDLRYEHQVVLEMAPGTSVAQATVDEQTAAEKAAIPSEETNAGTRSDQAKEAKPADGAHGAKPTVKDATPGKPANGKGKSTGAGKPVEKTASQKAAKAKPSAATKRAELSPSKPKSTTTAHAAQGE